MAVYFVTIETKSIYRARVDRSRRRKVYDESTNSLNLIPVSRKCFKPPITTVNLRPADPGVFATVNLRLDKA